MRKLKVRHDRLPGIGEVSAFDVASALTVTVAAHRSGRREVAIRPRDRDEVDATLSVTRTEALALAAVLSGTYIELTITPSS
jgi:K+/H+ antiporter YhaU regulatory subunit KhtT